MTAPSRTAGPRPALAAALGIALAAIPSAARASGPEEPWGDVAPLQPPMALRAIDRALTLREDAFSLFGSAEVGQFEPGRPAVALAFGSGYGVTSRLELGLVPLLLVLSPEPSTGLSDPAAYLEYRLLASDSAELSAAIESAVPLGGVYHAALRASFALRAGGLLRLDLEPSLSAHSRESWVGSAALDARVSLQLGDHVSLAARATPRLPRFGSGALVARLGIGASYAFGEGASADAALELALFSPDLELRGRLPDGLDLGRHPTAILAFTWFMDNPNEPNPLGGPEL